MSFQGFEFTPEMRKLVVNVKLFFDNDSPLAATTIGSVASNLFATIPAADISINVFPEATSDLVTLEAVDSGNTDSPGDGGPDEMTLIDLMASETTVMTLTATGDDLSPFINTSDLPADLTALAEFSVSGDAGNMDLSVDTLAEGKLTVGYNFTPIPEPSTLGFLAMGTLMIASLKFRRL